MDTSAVYALSDRRDVMHGAARRYYEALADREDFVLTLPIVTEACWLLEARLGARVAHNFREDLVRGAFMIHSLDASDLARSLEIDRAYADAGFGFADSTSMAACERLGIDTVFTFDRRDFAIYRTARGTALALVPQAIV